ncbi:HPr family phosphocarrier protein [Desulfatitalea alkaliphila]|uniref:HPr family phosphocarrier protein n=1 Tax=Desulfatitalea alkaliphila TaxID=2929485 RepID=A0AA41UNH2_9BACT|nr:HPr family phosphocarrier protein [Desulfatitalea alkaliphila]MCJ8499513.1 HPr family phosphocarrier protein [Desulfatitalea alkaliphila]
MQSDAQNELLREVVIVNALGLHARSAAKLAKIAQKADKGVWLHHGDEQVDAKEVIDILTLGAARGDRLQIRIDAPADRDTLDQIVALVNSGFGE